MPTYDYKCEKCGERFELFQTFAEEPLRKHPGKCKGKVVKVMSAAGIVFSGSGFYKTDNKDSSRSRSRAKSNDAAGAGASDSSSATSSSSESSSSTNGNESPSTSTTAKTDTAKAAPAKSTD